jgi:hypothetical protein
MPPQISLKVDTRNITRRLRRIEQGFTKTGYASTEEAGKYIRDAIKLYMPKDTGESARSIIYSTKVHKRGRDEVVIRRGFDPHPDRIGERGYRNKWFNLPRWMFESPNAIEHFEDSSGSIPKMREAPALYGRVFNVKVRNEINKILKK